VPSDVTAAPDVSFAHARKTTILSVFLAWTIAFGERLKG
jgi:hypothetical protein